MSDFRARLFLVTRPVETASDILPALEAALGAGDVACLLLRLASVPERAAKELVRQVAGVVQPRGTALLLEDARLAARTGADGAHVTGTGEAFTDALDSLKPERIVGVGGIGSRDDAMRAGEAGADYLMFGGPDRADDAASIAETLDQTAWWAEIFNVPCVGFAGTLDEVEGLAARGAEFVALGEAIWGDARGVAVAVAEADAAAARAAAPAGGENV